MPTSTAFALLTLALNAAMVTVAVVVLRRRTRPSTPPRHDRVGWQLYLNDLPNPCEDGHTRLYVTGRSADDARVICSVCTTELERPVWMDCDRCRWFPIDGHLHVSTCGTHTRSEAA